MAVMIGVDPHKGSHTAVAIDRRRDRARDGAGARDASPGRELLAWAARFEDRIWAVESAGGLGYLLAQQLVGAGEQVLDVPATLASRVRVLGRAGRTRTTGTTHCRSRSRRCTHRVWRAVGRGDHAVVLRL